MVKTLSFNLSKGVLRVFFGKILKKWFIFENYNKYTDLQLTDSYYTLLDPALTRWSKNRFSKGIPPTSDVT